MRDANTMSLTFDSLTVQNAKAALAEGVAAVRAGQTSIDLASLSVVDSSAVAVLLAWQRAAQAAKRPLRYLNLPANLLSLATLYGVDAFLTDSPADLQHH